MRVSGGGFVRKRAVGVAEREHQRAGAVAQLRLARGSPGDGLPLGHLDLLEPELERALVHHDVEELGDVGPEHERGHAGAADALRVHDAVGAGPAELLDAVLARGRGRR